MPKESFPLYITGTVFRGVRREHWGSVLVENCVLCGSPHHCTDGLLDPESALCVWCEKARSQQQCTATTLGMVGGGDPSDEEACSFVDPTPYCERVGFDVPSDLAWLCTLCNKICQVWKLYRSQPVAMERSPGWVCHSCWACKGMLTPAQISSAIVDGNRAWRHA